MELYGSLVVVLVAHTETEEEIHVISIRKAIKTNRRSSSTISDDAPKVTQTMLDGARFR